MLLLHFSPPLVLAIAGAGLSPNSCLLPHYPSHGPALVEPDVFEQALAFGKSGDPHAARLQAPKRKVPAAAEPAHKVQEPPTRTEPKPRRPSTPCMMIGWEATETTLHRRASTSALAACAAALVAVSPSVTLLPAAATAIEVVREAVLPPAAALLRVSEVTEMQEATLRRSADDTSPFKQRTGLNIGRQQMMMSIDLLLTNTKLGALP